MITKVCSIISLISASLSSVTYAQAPKISYPGPQTYHAGTTIPSLKPTNSGGVVATPSYSDSAVTLGLATAYSLGIAVDAAGNVYVADSKNSSVDKIPAGGGSPVIISNDVDAPVGITLDAAGNIYVSEENNADIKEIPAGGGTPVIVVSGINQPNAMAFDTKGNFYISSNDATTVFEIYAGTKALVPIGSGFNLPYGIAVDASGNVYVSDYGNNAVKKIPVNGGAVVTLGSGFSGPSGISVDPSGNVFVADYFNNALKEILVSGGDPVSLATGFNGPQGVGLDGRGNLYVLSGANGNTISEIKLTGGYFVNPALPSGLTLNTTTGIITGTPTTVSTSTNYIVTAYNTSGTSSAPVTISVLPSTNANLSSLKPSRGALSPAFSSTITSYTASVVNGVTSMTLTPTTTNAGATVKVNGTVVTSGSASQNLPVVVGTNTIPVKVTAQDGVTTKTYTITVTRAKSANAYMANLTPSAGALSPTFSASKTAYTEDVVNGAATITITPVTAVPTSTVTVNGVAVASGKASAPIALNIGANTITTIVTAQDGVTTKTYTVTVTRAASANANLSAFKISRGTLTPVFNTNTDTYTANVVNGVTSMMVTPTTVDTTASMTVNGTTVASGTASGPLALAVGANTITTVVTAQDGITTKTYTLTVTRAAGAVDSYNPGISVSKPEEAPTLEDDIILVHQAISPNGDGINDFLVIDGIQAYPDNKLSIMNRSGQLIYEATGYDNSSKVFDGHSNKNGQMQLPGTYFYQLDYTVNGITKHKTGFLVLKY
jgi:gliding motility-associated-like protein